MLTFIPSKPATQMWGCSYEAFRKCLQNETFKFSLHLLRVSTSLQYFFWKLNWFPSKSKLNWFLSKSKEKCSGKFSKHFVWRTPSLFWNLLQTMLLLLISEVKWYHKVELMLKTLERLGWHIGSFTEWHESMCFLIWVSLHSRQRSIPVTGISKKLFCTVQSFRHSKVH